MDTGSSQRSRFEESFGPVAVISIDPNGLRDGSRRPPSRNLQRGGPVAVRSEANQASNVPTSGLQ